MMWMCAWLLAALCHCSAPDWGNKEIVSRDISSLNVIISSNSDISDLHSYSRDARGQFGIYAIIGDSKSCKNRLIVSAWNIFCSDYDRRCRKPATRTNDKVAFIRNVGDNGFSVCGAAYPCDRNAANSSWSEPGIFPPRIEAARLDVASRSIERHMPFFEIHPGAELRSGDIDSVGIGLDGRISAKQCGSGRLACFVESVSYIKDADDADRYSGRRRYEHPLRPYGHILLGLQVCLGGLFGIIGMKLICDADRDRVGRDVDAGAFYTFIGFMLILVGIALITGIDLFYLGII